MMTGAEAIRTGASAALALTRTDLAERAASRERERLSRLASQWEISDKLIAHLAMCVTLQGGCSAEEAFQLVIEERRAMGFPETGPPDDLVSRLGEALPMPGGVAVDAMRPDLIGEALLLQGMQQHRSFPTMQTEILDRAWGRVDGKVAATLIRTAQDYAHGDAGHRSVVWLRYVFDRIDDFAALMELAAEVPQQTLALRELAAVVEERINAAATEAATGEPRLRALLANARNNLANRLSDLGRREPALAAAEEAAGLYRELAGQRPDAFRPDLAMSLNNLANRLSALGRREPALAAAEEAVAIRRELAGQRPDGFRPDLAVSLAVQANCLDALGRSTDALMSNVEAVKTLCPAFVEQPAAFGHWMGPMVRQYLERSEQLGQSPDMDLLAPIIAAMQEKPAQTEEQSDEH
jgi:tetratricopeptide (TPR) repeat protein